MESKAKIRFSTSTKNTTQITKGIHRENYLRLFSVTGFQINFNLQNFLFLLHSQTCLVVGENFWNGILTNLLHHRVFTKDHMGINPIFGFFVFQRERMYQKLDHIKKK